MGDKNLERLIETIKREAIEAADRKVSEMLENAEREANDIIKSAKAKKASLIEEAEKRAESTLSKGQNALNQAVRDLSIMLHNDVNQLFKSVLQQEVDASFTPDLVKSAVLKILEQMGTKSEVQLPASLKNEVAAYIQKQLQHTKDLTKISTNTALVKGFIIANEEEGWSYQITPEEVTELIYSQLSNQWKMILNSKQ